MKTLRDTCSRGHKTDAMSGRSDWFVVSLVITFEIWTSLSVGVAGSRVELLQENLLVDPVREALLHAKSPKR